MKYKIKDGQAPNFSKAVYQDSEYALSIERVILVDQVNPHSVLPSIRIGGVHDFFLHLGTFTMTFSSLSGELTSIDAYSNRRRWRARAKLQLPELAGTGILVAIADSSDFEVPRSENLETSFCKESGLLFVSWAKDLSGTSYFRIGSSIVVGLICEQIVCLYIEGVSCV